MLHKVQAADSTHRLKRLWDKVCQNRLYRHAAVAIGVHLLARVVLLLLGASGIWVELLVVIVTAYVTAAICARLEPKNVD